MHLDAPERGVVERVVAEAAQVEIAAQLAVDAREQVQVERRGDAARVVVGRVQDVGVLLQVDADQHRALRPDLGTRHAQEGLRLRRRQVADGRAGKIDHAATGNARAPAASGISSGREKSPCTGRSSSQGKRRRSFAAARGQRGGGYVHRDVGRRPQRRDQQARFAALAAAVFDERAAPAGEARDRAQVRARERELAARRVVLLQPADALEQPAAPGIVEILGRQGLLRQRQAGDDILAEAVRERCRCGWGKAA